MTLLTCSGRAMGLFLLLLATALPASGATQVPSADPASLDASSAAGNEARADYVLHARLEAEGMKLTGEGTLTWRSGASEDSTDRLFFHLHHNAFAGNRTTHLLEAGGKLRGAKPRKEDWGWQKMTSLRLKGGEDLLPSLEWGPPTGEPAVYEPLAGADGENPEPFMATEDRTVFSVRLPSAVAPGETLELEFGWEAELPRVRRRTGFKGDFILASHWFPKLGVFEDGRGWNAHVFHRDTEFFADFGTYDVTLDLPVDYADKVGASGILNSQSQDGERYVANFLVPSMPDRERAERNGTRPLVHGFAWTADTDYHVFQKEFVYADWAEKYAEEVSEVRAALGREDVSVRDVRVTVLMQPERVGQAERHYEATCAALFFYGLWYGEYPYEHITVVDPAWGGSAAGGMEYPTIFTAGTSLYTFPEMHKPESVTVHEAGHQFWYGIVGNNEYEAAWLDEGLNSYTDSEVLKKHWGDQHSATYYGGFYLDGVRPFPASASGVARIFEMSRIPIGFGRSLKPLRSSGFLNLWRDVPCLTLTPSHSDPRWGDRGGYLNSPDTDPLTTFAFQHADRGSYRTNSYPRTAVTLRTLRGIVGKDAFLRGIRHFAEEWRFRHPYPEDFFTSFQTGSGVDLEWFFDSSFRGSQTVDWSVDVSQRSAPDTAGFRFDEEGGEFVRFEGETDSDEDAGTGDPEEEPDEESNEESGDDVAESDEEQKPDKPSLVNVLVKRSGELRIPLLIRWTFEDGESGEHLWTREEQERSAWWRMRVESGRELRSVVLDPERVLYLDQDMSNNQWYSKPDRVAPWRWAERVMTQASHLHHFRSRIGG